MSFKEAVEATVHLEHAWMPGLQALRAKDRPHVDSDDTRLFCGSADIDSALQQSDPHAHRWDFAIGYRHTNRQAEFIYWVEIHTAADREVRVVLQKLQWLRAWLPNGGQPLSGFDREFVWVSSDANSFTRNAPVVKLCAQNGLRYVTRVLRIPSQRHPSP